MESLQCPHCGQIENPAGHAARKIDFKISDSKPIVIIYRCKSCHKGWSHFPSNGHTMLIMDRPRVRD